MSDRTEQAWPQKTPFPYRDTGTPYPGGDNDGARLPPVVIPPLEPPEE